MFLKKEKNKDTNSKNSEHSQDGGKSGKDISAQKGKPTQLQSMIDNSPKMVAQRKHNEQLFGKSIQKKKDKEEENPLQKKAKEEEEPLQKKATKEEEKPVQKKSTNTGLPENLKSGVENLSGMSMEDVKVHYNSPKPAEVQAHAYAQGTDIHLAAGQEKHLPHEAWHVAQQKQGRVQPTVQMKGVAVNDDSALEKEADEMGAKAIQGKFEEEALQKKEISGASNSSDIVQKVGWWDTIKKGAGVYLGLTLKDEGSAYAKGLMRHYALGGGSTFNPETSSVNYPTDKMWSSFMVSRPEIQRAMFSKFASLALKLGGGPDKNEAFKESITGVKLNELESMRWTLHGCHRIDISGNVQVVSSGTDKKIIFSNVKFNWIDVGDMHPGTTTEMDNGETVDDAEFTGAGSSFPIDIPFYMSGTSVWGLSNNVLEQKSGWPNNGAASSTPNRK